MARTTSNPKPKPGAKTRPSRASAGTQSAGAREARSAARRDAILAAALEEFSAAGFAAARLDDVARRAGVAKGTIYLHFKDKEDLFQELVRSMLKPLVLNVEAISARDVPFHVVAEHIVELFANEILATRRKDVIRLILSEGQRFPKLAEFYYREVVSRAVAAMSALLQRAYDRGEIRHAALARFPQLLVAPALVAVLWGGLFDRFAPLDVRALMRAHIDILFGERKTS